MKKTPTIRRTAAKKPQILRKAAIIRKAVSIRDIVLYPLGGFTPNPPDDCTGRKFYHHGNNLWWVDNVICGYTCQKRDCRLRGR